MPYKKYSFLLALLFTTLAIVTASSTLQGQGTDSEIYLPLINSGGQVSSNLSLSPECTSDLYKELSQISIHTDDPRLEVHSALLAKCNAELLQRYEADDTRASQADRTIAPLEGLINFETPHVHPMDLTPDGQTLVAVNIAAHQIEVYQVSGTTLLHQQSIPVGLDPVSVRARTNSEVWVVNHVSDSVSIVDLNQGTVVQTLDTDNEPADVVFAGTPQRAFVTASEANAINVYEVGNLNAAPQTVSIFGEDPRSLAVSPNGQTVYAAIFESGNNTTIQGEGEDATIVRRNSLADNDVAIINANTLSVQFQSGLMTMNMALGVNPATNDITVVGTESLNEIALEPNINGVFLRVRMASFPQGGSVQTRDLNPHLNYSSSTVAQSVRNQSIGDPRGIAWLNDGSQAFITGMGSNNVIVVNQQGIRLGRIEVGEGPTGIVLKASANLGFVMNKFSGSISIINLNSLQEINEVPFDDPTPAVIKNGRSFLYDTHQTSGLGHVSCASCHVDARADRLAWDLGDPNGPSVSVPEASNSLPGGLTGNTISVPALKGPMVTQSLQDIMEHPLLHWRGDRADLSEFNPAFQNLMGDDEQLTAAEMQAFGQFLDTIWLQPNPYRNLDDSRPNTVTLPDGSTVTSGSLNALRGNNSNSNNCLACHSGQGNATRNFGVNDEIGSEIIAPAFPGFYDKIGFSFGTSGFGFFHTGEADLNRAARVTVSESSDDFLAELLTIGGPSGPLTGAEQRQVPHAGVGKQLTINGTPTSAQNNLLNQFKNIAQSSSFAALMAKAKHNGLQRGFVYLGNDNFQSDRQAEQISLTQLLNTSNGAVTFTLVADGMETRLALDSDLDGIFNGDEVLTIGFISDQQDEIGTSVSLTVQANDPDGDPLTFSANGLPLGLSINTNSGVISGAPNTLGFFNVTVAVNDNTGESASTSFNWTINRPIGTLFFDNFESDTGWTRNPNGSDSASTGLWERADPQSTSSGGTTLQLGNAFSGANCLVTEGTAGSSVGTNDVDSGTTSIRSPAISLPSATPIELSFHYYLAHLNNATSADFLRVKVVGNSTTTILEELGASDADAGAWEQAVVSLDSFAGQTIHLLIEAADAGSGSLIEAGVDDVRLTAPINVPPQLTSPGNQVNTVNEPVNLTVSATDADGDSLTYSASGLPNGLGINSNNGAISGSATTEGSFNVTLTVVDGNGGSDSASFVWTISPQVNGSAIQLHARGSAGGEVMELLIDGQFVQSWIVTTNLQVFAYTHNSTVTAGQIRVAFTNNGRDPVTNADRNLIVDKISVDGTDHETEAASVEGFGVWTGSNCTTVAFHQNEVLACNGYFQYDSSPITSCGSLVQEAEAAQLGGNFVIGNDGNASGGQFIRVPNGDGNQWNGPSADRADFCFDITTGGTYRLLGTVLATSGGNNSFYVTIDGAPTEGYLWDTVIDAANYMDDYLSQRGGADPLEFNLGQGEHTITIFAREDGTILDKVALELVNEEPPLVNCNGLNREAEEGILRGGFVTGNDANASGGQYVHLPNGTGNNLNGATVADQAEYCFTVPTAGTYLLEGTVLATSGGNNSFYVTVDGQPATGYLWDTAVNAASYIQDFVSNRGVADPVQLTLNAGEHTVIIYPREDGTILDKLALLEANNLAQASQHTLEDQPNDNALYGTLLVPQLVSQEPNIAELQVSILNATSSEVVVTTETSNTGKYYVDGLPDGNYHVQIEVKLLDGSAVRLTQQVSMMDQGKTEASFDYPVAMEIEGGGQRNYLFLPLIE
ncbi:MAG: putative Ig domain-containing protein [Chloroflexota bacterium]